MAASQAPTAESGSKNRPTVLPDATLELNLHQRIALIKRGVQIKQTGRTAQNSTPGSAMSIADVDRALGDLMADHGVNTNYDFIEAPVSYDEQTRNGTMRIWRVHIRGYLINVDNPPKRGPDGTLVGGDYDQAELWDDGTNVSGAVSFALKRWEREVFKLAEDDTSPQLQQRAERGERSEFSNPRDARGNQSAEFKPNCPECTEPLYRSRGRTDEDKAHPEKLGWFCWKNDERGKHGCGAKFAVDDERIVRQSERQAEEAEAEDSDPRGDEPSTPPVEDEATKQRKELAKLHSELPADFQLPVEKRRELLAEGYETAKATLLAIKAEAVASEAESGATSIEEVDNEQAIRDIDAQQATASLLDRDDS